MTEVQPGTKGPTISEPEPHPPAKVAILPQAGEQITSSATQNTYTIGDRIGEGSFGVVFACKDVWENASSAESVGRRPRKLRGSGL